MKTTHLLTVLSYVAAVTAAAVNADLFEIAIDTAGYGNNNVALVGSLDELLKTHRRAKRGFGAMLWKPGVFCQAFRDPEGSQPLGETFSAGQPAVFAEKKDGPVHIGSFYCSIHEDVVGPGERSNKPTNRDDRGELR